MRDSPFFRGALLAAAGAWAPFAAAGETAPGMGNALWGANYFPNVELTTHEGKRVLFFDDLIDGKVVVINFIYTRCPDACPLETAKLSEVKRILGDRVGSDTFFYSISIDPSHDTPEVLHAYARRYRAGPGWLFLTGDERDIATLRKKFGLYDTSGETNLSQHSLSLVIGNQATGRWMKASPMENSHVLATQIGDWLHNWKLPRDPGRDYANAPKLREISRGESLFRTRCASCHPLGGGKENEPYIGPDLFGVTERRERPWLERWLVEPDKMLAEKDPVAIRLFEAFNHVPMPNVRLESIEVEDLIDFLESETARIRVERPGFAVSDGAEALGEPPHACCQKETSVTIGPGGGEEAPSPRRAPRFGPFSFASIGLGIVLALVALALRRR